MSSSTKINVTFKDKSAALLDIALIESNEYPVVLAISSCKIRHCEDLKKNIICNTAATRISANGNTEIASNLRKR